jgi:hypothetical protein
MTDAKKRKLGGTSDEQANSDDDTKMALAWNHKLDFENA